MRLWIEAHVVERVLRGVIRSSQVVIAGADEELHKGIALKGVAQGLRGVREAAAGGPPVPVRKAKAAAQDVILQIRLVAEFSAHILIEHCRVRRTDGALAGIVAGRSR